MDRSPIDGITEMSSNILAWLSGKKLIFAAVVGIVAILANHFLGHIPGMDINDNNWLADIWSLLLIIFGGAKVQKVVDGQEEAKAALLSVAATRGPLQKVTTLP